MISRHWKGIVRPGLADEYLNHLKAHTLPELAGLPGFISVSILKRAIAGGTEFQVVTRWASLDSIRGFAGDDIEAAVVPDVAARMMMSYDSRVVHYDVVTV
jgi:heme-degrading monooxygenase HmoA